MAEFFSLENLERFCARNPNSIAFAHLASRYIEIDRFEEALDICEDGVKDHPDYAFGHYILALSYLALKNVTSAKEELQLALAYDTALPEAWKILATIDAKQDLPASTRESNLNYFLLDYLDERAADNFWKSDVASVVAGGEEVITEETFTGQDEEVTQAASEEEISQLFETEEPSEAEEFEKTLDEVFKDTVQSPAGETTETELSPEDENVAPDEAVPEELLKDETEAPEDEFTDAMDSFFQHYADESEAKEEVEEGELKQAEESPEEEAAEISFDSELEIEEEETQPEEMPQEATTQENVMAEESETASEEHILDELQAELEDEEPMDFSAVVADIISERDEKEKPAEAEAGEGGETEPEHDVEETGMNVPEKEVEEAGGETEISETAEELKLPPETETAKSLSEAAEEKPEQSGEEDILLGDEKGETTHFGRPPILSPTLGEIYTSQGRFEEAIDVFRQLLEKDPENARFERKIKDLEAVIKRQK